MRLTSLMSSADGALGGSELRRPRLGEVSCDDRRGSRRNDDEIYNKNKKAKKKSTYEARAHEWVQEGDGAHHEGEEEKEMRTCWYVVRSWTT